MRPRRGQRASLGATVVVLAGWLAVVPAVASAQDWRQLSPQQRYDVLRNYWQYERLPEDQQKAVDQGYERWRRMPEDERAKVRENFERLRNLPPDERERFERRYEKWRQQATPGR